MAAITPPQLLFIYVLTLNLHQSTPWTPNWNNQQSTYTAKSTYYNTVAFTGGGQFGNSAHQLPLGQTYTQGYPQQQQASYNNNPYGPVVHPPPQFEELFLPAPPGQTPRCAKGGATYCEVVDYYPKKVILKLLQQGKFDLNTLLLNEKIINQQKYYPKPEPYVPPQYYYKPQYRQDWVNLTTAATLNASAGAVPPISSTGWRGKRQAFGSQTLCDQRAGSRIIFAAMNVDGTWKYVVNFPEIGTALTQRITTQECINPNSFCRTDLCTPPSNVRSRCVQQIVQTRLVALHPSGNRLTNDVFQIPSACVCSFSFG